MSPSAPACDKSLARELVELLWQVPLWAVPFALVFGTLFGARWHDYVISYEISLVFSLVIRLALLTYEFGLRPFVRERWRDRPGGWATDVIGYGTASILASYLAAAIIHFTLMPGFLGNPRAFAVTGIFALIFTGLIGGLFTARALYRVAVERARAAETARAELARAELRALRAQIQPHFLFNALNSIAALVRENPIAAEDTVTRLADVFRYALRASGSDHARLADELEFARAMLDIERVRFGDRLRVAERVEPGLDDARVPSLLLQPLVENAVRHGAGARLEGGTVTLVARRAGDTLVLEVVDDGPGFAAGPDPGGNGFGLHSVRERLRLAGPPHALGIESTPGHGARVRVVLPLLSTPSTSGGPR